LKKQKPTGHDHKEQQAQIVGRKLCFAVFHHYTPKQRAFLHLYTRKVSAKSMTNGAKYFAPPGAKIRT